MIKLGPFNYLGLEALTSPQEYMPDFSAKVINKARLLRIRRKDYLRVLEMDQAQRKSLSNILSQNFGS